MKPSNVAIDDIRNAIVDALVLLCDGIELAAGGQAAFGISVQDDGTTEIVTDDGAVFAIAITRTY